MSPRFQVVQDALLPWLHLVHSVTPGAGIFLVCSHAKSPPTDGSDWDADSWEKNVETMAMEVYEKVLLNPGLLTLI
jgi:hypothetical protein